MEYCKIGGIRVFVVVIVRFNNGEHAMDALHYRLSSG